MMLEIRVADLHHIGYIWDRSLRQTCLPRRSFVVAAFCYILISTTEAENAMEHQDKLPLCLLENQAWLLFCFTKA